MRRKSHVRCGGGHEETRQSKGWWCVLCPPLLFYHRKLRCLVAVELKAGPFQPEHAGKMQFYLSALDDQVRLEDENPSIGIIVARSKDRTIVEYTLRGEVRPIGVATYNRYGSLEDIPERIARYLPSPAELEQRLGGTADTADASENSGPLGPQQSAQEPAQERD